MTRPLPHGLSTPDGTDEEAAERGTRIASPRGLPALADAMFRGLD